MDYGKMNYSQLRAALQRAKTQPEPEPSERTERILAWFALTCAIGAAGLLVAIVLIDVLRRA